ncbi:MAG: tail fiber domain-containing protein [Ferruginibacter sp.]
MKKMIVIFAFLHTFIAKAQNVGIGTNSPNANALLELSSSNKGLLLPRLADTNAVTGAKPAGLTIYSSSDNKLYFFNGSKWQPSATSLANDSLWYVKNDSVLATKRKYVSIRDNEEAIPQSAALQVNGSLLVQAPLIVGKNAPTAAQQVVMNNLGDQLIDSPDSVYRVFDPGAAANYNNGSQGNVRIVSNAINGAGFKVSFNEADFGIAQGDTLWISNDFFPGCRTNYFQRYTNTTTAPSAEQFYSLNNTYLFFHFRSNNDGFVDKGFDITVRKIFNSIIDEPETNVVGKSFHFDIKNASLTSGRKGSFVAGRYSASFGESQASGDYSLASGSSFASAIYSLSTGYYSKAEGWYSFAGGDRSTTNGNAAISYGFANNAGNYSASFGLENNSLGFATFTTGERNRANAKFGAAIGRNNVSNGVSATVVGQYNDSLINVNNSGTPLANDPLFLVGNGSASNARSNALSVLYNGNAGIGNVNPQVRLHIKSALNEAVRIEGPTPYISMYDNGIYKGYLQCATDGLALGSTSTWPVNFYTNGFKRATILSNGNIGIGVETPLSALHITAPTFDALRVQGPNPAIQMFNGATNVGFIQAFGNEMTMGSQPGSQVVFRTNGGAYTVYNGTTTGSYTTSGWQHSSDETLKIKIKSIETPLQKIMQLRGVNYHWKQKPDTEPQIGFIAQEVEKIFPETVTKNKDGTYGMAYQNLVAPLVEAVKEQQKQIEELKAEIKKLKEK